MHLDDVKKILNPKDVSPFGKDGDAAIGPRVIATGAMGVPDISPHSHILFDDIVLRGPIHVGEGSMVRRHSVVEGNLAPNVALMDYVRLEPGSSVGEHSVIAHGAKLDRNVRVGSHGILNINVHMAEEAGLADFGDLYPKASIEPKLHVPGNVRIAGNNKHYKTFPNASLGVHDNQLELTDINGSVRNNYIESSTNPIRSSDLLHVRRPDFPSFTQLPGVSFTNLLEMGSKGWFDKVSEVTGRNRSSQHVPRSNWLLNYGVQQQIKQMGYLRDEVKRHGEIVWYAAPIQAELLMAYRAKELLAQDNPALSDEVTDCIEAWRYLLGAYKPEKHELAKLDHAFTHSADILGRAAKAVSALRAPMSILLPAEQSIAQLYAPAGERYSLGADDLATISQRVQQGAETLGSIAGRFAGLEATDVSSIASSEKTDMENWRAALNKHHQDMRYVEGGSQVHAYHGIVPVIAHNALVYGADISGVVDIHDGAVIDESSLRSERYIAPIAVSGEAVLRHTLVHTAMLDEEPAVIYPGAVCDGSVGKEIWLHGAEVGQPEGAPTYISGNTVISDGATVRGIMLEGTLEPGQKHPDWGIYEGNVSRDLLKAFVPLNEAASNDEIKAQWEHTRFSGIDITDEAALKHKIGEIADERRKEIEAKIQAKELEYGPIFRSSPALQSAMLNLRYGAEIMNARGQEEAARNFEAVADGIEYLLGARQEISPQAAKLTKAFLEGGAPRIWQSSKEAFDEIVAKNETVEIPSWPEDGVRIGFTEAKQRIEAAKNPMLGDKPLSDPVQEQTRLAIGRTIREFPDLRKPIIPQEVIDDRFKSTLQMFPEYLQIMQRQLEQVPALLAELGSKREIVRPGP